MPRVKGEYVTRQRRKRTLKLAKGYYGAKHLLFKTAKQQVMKSYMYAYRDRRQKKRELPQGYHAETDRPSENGVPTWSTQAKGQ